MKNASNFLERVTMLRHPIKFNSDSKHDSFLIPFDDIYCVWWHLRRRIRLFSVRRCSHHCRIIRSLSHFHLVCQFEIGAFVVRIHAVYITRFPYDLMCVILFFCKGGNTWLSCLCIGVQMLTNLHVFATFANNCICVWEL